MKRVFTISLAILFAGLYFLSCQKPATEPETSQSIIGENFVNPYLSAEQKAIMMDELSVYMNREDAARSIESISPLFVFDNIAVLTFISEDQRKNATFTTELDGNDYFIDNSDGTVTIQINSNNAVSELTDLMTGNYYIGQKGHAMMDYTGYVMIFPLDDYLPYFMYIFLPDEYTPPAVWHGNGKVQLNGTGPKKNLVAHLSADEGWTNLNNFVKLN
jgi:hypothetical protein